jgi:hypothetical protein
MLEKARPRRDAEVASMRMVLGYVYEIWNGVNGNTVDGWPI